MGKREAAGTIRHIYPYLAVVLLRLYDTKGIGTELDVLQIGYHADKGAELALVGVRNGFCDAGCEVVVHTRELGDVHC